MKRLIFIFITALIFYGSLIPKEASAFILINEFLADPGSGLLGDANNDGVRSSSDDEFIELVNFGDNEILLSNWYLKDSASIRHAFDIGVTLMPYECIVIFGGGNPTGFDVQVFTASSGSLSLNNSGDTIRLFDSNHILINEVMYSSEGGQDQSVSRYPDGSPSFFLHSEILDSEGALFSPGRKTNGQPFSAKVVPEPATAVIFGMGFVGYLLGKKKGVVNV